MKIDFYNYKEFYSIFSEIFIGNSYFFKSKKPVIIDGGANIGIATLYFKYLYPEAEIHAFEPDKDTFRLLKKNIEQNNLTNVYLYKEALWTKDGKLTFYINKKKAGHAGNSVISHNANTKKITVNSISLSKFLKNKKVDFLKVDIEGSEPEVFKDLYTKNRLKNIKETVIEFHHYMGDKKTMFGDFLNLLEKSGFKYQISGDCYPLYSKNKQQTILVFAYKS